MQMDDGTFLKWATGTLIAIFTTIFGSHKYTQSQIDKHKEATDTALSKHREEVHAFDCVHEKDCKEDREHLADHMKRTTKSVEDMSKAILKELRSINTKIFEIVKDK